MEKHHKDTCYIFLDLYSLHSGFFPNNEFKSILGSFTASSQLNVPTWIQCSLQTTHSCLLCRCALIKGQAPTEHMAQDCGMKRLSVRECLVFTQPPKEKKKWQVYNSNWEWREFNTSHQAAALLSLLGKIRQEEKPRFGGLLRHS